uniref:Kelch domain-containing protein 9 n=1 Tax=Mesocestoides corti TaxID=53468 RepID=A0A5K3FMX1_MESCO
MKARTPAVHVYDTNTGRWLPPAVEEPFLKGFPPGAGLSGHSVVPLVTQGNTPAALVIGREGSLRMQRRHGNAYILRGHFERRKDKARGDLDSSQSYFTYSELPSVTQSRSHHTTTPMSKHLAVTFGGRSTGLVETMTLPEDTSLDCKSFRCKAVAQFLQHFTPTENTSILEAKANQIGLRGHYAVSGGDAILIGGGESFDALKRNPNSDAFIYKLNSKNPLHLYVKLCYQATKFTLLSLFKYYNAMIVKIRD